MDTVFNFIPVSGEEMERHELWWYDFLIVSGDAYVDHPSFGAASLGRTLEAEKYRVAILPQPDIHSADAFREMGRPRLGVIIDSGLYDSMEANYNSVKKHRNTDPRSPGGKGGRRPDRACVVYANRAREAFPGLPVILCGTEASARRFAHYDYLENKVRRSVLADAGADILVYGAPEDTVCEIAACLKKKQHVSEITGIRGTAVMIADPSEASFETEMLPSFDEVVSERRLFAQAVREEYAALDPYESKALLQQHGNKYLLVNPPAMPMTAQRFDFINELPYKRTAHPMYRPFGGVPAAEDIRFSVVLNRGCIQECAFSEDYFIYGHYAVCRTAASVLREIQSFASHPDFKGNVSDCGSAFACLFAPDEHSPSPDTAHDCYTEFLHAVRKAPKVKHFSVVSRVYPEFIVNDDELVALLAIHHLSGHINAAPEHFIPSVLDSMGLPHADSFIEFTEKCAEANRNLAKVQHVVPLVISAHPGCTLDDMIALACRFSKDGIEAESVCDFYPLPGTISTCMYFSEIDPRSMKSVVTVKDTAGKELNRTVMQFRRPDKRKEVTAALREAGRYDLIGFGDGCLIHPDFEKKKGSAAKKAEDSEPVSSQPEKPKKPVSKKGWAKAKPKKAMRPSSSFGKRSGK